MSVGEIQKEPLGYYFFTEMLPGFAVRTSITCPSVECKELGQCRAHDRALRVLVKRARKDKQRALSDKAFLRELEEALVP